MLTVKVHGAFLARSKEGGDPCEAAAALPTMRHQRSRNVTFARGVFRRNASPLVVVRTGLWRRFPLATITPNATPMPPKRKCYTKANQRKCQFTGLAMLTQLAVASPSVCAAGVRLVYEIFHRDALQDKRENKVCKAGYAIVLAKDFA